MKTSEEELIALYFERSEEALSVTDSRYGGYCRAIARNLLFDDHDAEECVNDTYLRVWNAIPPLRPKSFKAYIGALCRHTAIDRIKEREASKRGADRCALLFNEFEECIASPEEELSDRVALRDALNRFLRALNGEARVIFMQRYWYACSVEEIAQKRRKSVGAVKMSLHRTRENLREFLKKEGF